MVISVANSRVECAIAATPDLRTATRQHASTDPNAVPSPQPRGTRGGVRQGGAGRSTPPGNDGRRMKRKETLRRVAGLYYVSPVNGNALYG